MLAAISCLQSLESALVSTSNEVIVNLVIVNLANIQYL